MTIMEASAVDEAVIARLQQDAELSALLPDGVYWDMAPHGGKAFCVVSLVRQSSESVFGQRAIETTVYAVKAVVLNSVQDIRAAADRIDELLDDTTLTVAGATFMCVHRDEEDGRIRRTEPDDVNKAIVWYHRGARYRVEVSL